MTETYFSNKTVFFNTKSQTFTTDMESDEENQAISGTLTLDDFKLWSSMSLKSFLSLRNRSVNGSIEVLAARLVELR